MRNVTLTCRVCGNPVVMQVEDPPADADMAAYEAMFNMCARRAAHDECARQRQQQKPVTNDP